MDNLAFLVDMGFDEDKAKDALHRTKDNMQEAMELLLTESEPSNPTPGPSGENSKENVEGTDKNDEVAKSIKCDECQKLFKSNCDVEFHAAKSGHTSFSESTDEKKPMTTEQKQLKLKDLEEKMKQRRVQREEDEKKDAIDKEKNRIQMSKDISEIKRKVEEEEVKRLVEERKREKRDDKLARERVKQEIARDREARKLKFGMQSDVTAISPIAPIVSNPNTTCPPRKEYDNAKLQIRFPSGAPLIHEFSSKEPLANVRLWISLNRIDGMPNDAPFNLATTFPRKIFTEEDMEKPLNILGLVPTAVLILTGK